MRLEHECVLGMRGERQPDASCRVCVLGVQMAALGYTKVPTSRPAERVNKDNWITLKHQGDPREAEHRFSVPSQLMITPKACFPRQIGIPPARITLHAERIERQQASSQNRDAERVKEVRYSRKPEGPEYMMVSQ